VVRIYNKTETQAKRSRPLEIQEKKPFVEIPNAVHHPGQTHPAPGTTSGAMESLPPELWIVFFLGGIGIVAAGRAITRQRREVAAQRRLMRRRIEEHDPHPPPDGIADNRLTIAIHHLFDQIEPPVHLEKHIDDIDRLLPPGDAIHLYRIFEKCCVEALRQPGPGNVTVLVKKASTVIHATIETDQRVPDRSRLDETIERARIIGGMMTIDSPSPGRTTMTITVPLA